MTDPLAIPDDEFDDLLAACDEQLAHGATSVGNSGSTIRAVPDHLVDRLESAKKCLIALELTWPRRNEMEFVLPESIGRYRILRQLGQGGFGIVFLAGDPQLKRQVALKVPHAVWILSREGYQRFLREAEAVARLNHPHIISIYEVGQANGVPYISSEFCDGPNLASWLAARTQPVPIRDAAEFVETLADAMHHAHDRGVLHRDLKPANVLLAHGSSEASFDVAAELASFSPRIMDFGLAKVMSSERESARTGALFGTLAYSAPEQAEGRAQDISVQTDVYVLGAMLYELLTGKPPNREATEAATLQRILLGETPSPRRLRPDVPADLAAICLKCLEKTPARRYSSAAALADDLQRFLEGRPTLASPMTMPQRAWRWAKRRPALAGLLGVSVAASVIVIAGTFIYNSRLNASLARIEKEAAVNRKLLYSSNVRLASESLHANSVLETLDVLSTLVPADGLSDQREFTWNYLWKTCHSDALTIRGHTEDVYQVTFSPDGDLLASAGKDGTARLWDPRSGRLIRELLGHKGEVNVLVFVSNRKLASAGDDGTVILWDTVTGERITSLAANNGAVYALAASDARGLLASGGDGKQVHLWDLNAGKLLWISPKTAIVESLSFSPDGKRLVCGHRDGSTRWWDVDQRKELQHEQSFADWAASVAYSTDLPEVAVAGRKGILRTYREDSNGRWLAKDSRQFGPRAAGIDAVAFSPRDNTLATGSRDGKLQLWNPGAGLLPLGELPGHGDRVWCVAWSPDGRSLASSSADGSVKVWDIPQSAGCQVTYPPLASGILSVSVSPDNRSILTGSFDGSLHEWDRHTRQTRRLSVDPANRFTGICHLDSGNLAFSAGSKDGLRRWNLKSESYQSISTDDLFLPCSMAIATDAKLLAVGCEHQRAVLFDTETGHVRHRFNTRALDVRCIALSYDGQWLATAGVNAELELWNAQTGRRECGLVGHAGEVLSLTFSPDGQTLVSGGSDQRIRLWQVPTGQLAATFLGQPAVVTALAISPDGRTLASGSHQPALIKTWDLRTLTQLMLLEDKAYDVNALAFTRDGRSLIAGCGWADAGQLVEFNLDRHDDLSATEMPNTKPTLQALATPRQRNTEPDAAGLKQPTPAAIDLFQAVNAYARRSGFAAGYPTFRSPVDDKVTVVEAVLLRGDGVKKVFVQIDDFRDSRDAPRADFKSQDEMLSGLLLSIDRWSNEKGYVGALPTFYAATSSDATLAYEVELLSGSPFSRETVELQETDSVAGVPSTFRKVHTWAVEAGYVSALPTFHTNGNRLECVIVRPGAAEVIEIPIGELQLKTSQPLDSR